MGNNVNPQSLRGVFNPSFPMTTTYATPNNNQGSRNVHTRAASSLGGTVTSPIGPVISNLMSQNPGKY